LNQLVDRLHIIIRQGADLIYIHRHGNKYLLLRLGQLLVAIVP